MQHSKIDMKLASNCQVLDFHDIELHEKHKGYWVITVRGLKPCANMKVDLIPVIYVRQPEYTAITVRGCSVEEGTVAVDTPYEVKLPLSACRGTKGVEIIGASKVERVDIPKD